MTCPIFVNFQTEKPKHKGIEAHSTHKHTHTHLTKLTSFNSQYVGDFPEFQLITVAAKSQCTFSFVK